MSTFDYKVLPFGDLILLYASIERSAASSLVPEEVCPYHALFVQLETALIAVRETKASAAERSAVNVAVAEALYTPAVMPAEYDKTFPNLFSFAPRFLKAFGAKGSVSPYNEDDQSTSIPMFKVEGSGLLGYFVRSRKNRRFTTNFVVEARSTVLARMQVGCFDIRQQTNMIKMFKTHMGGPK
jgi:hypothetical protein